MFIRSERLFLRPVWPEDAGELTALLRGADGVMSNIYGLHQPHGDAIRAERGVRRADALADLVITLPTPAGATLMGGIALTSEHGDGSREARLGYWLGRSYWGHGYAAEAARGMLAIARMLGHARVFANQSVDGRASLLVLTRAGFRATGERRVEGEHIAAVYVAEVGGGHDSGHDGADEMRAA